MTRLPLLALVAFVPAPLLSCAVPAERSAPVAQAVAVAAPSAEAEEEVAADEDPETVMPRGAFPSIEALCVAQKELAAPAIAKANEERAERYEGPSAVTAACEESKDALTNVSLHVGAPFHEVRAITVETGNATETHLVVRTDEGWQAAQQAVISDFHDDPGCPSIRRDGGLREIRVERGALVVVSTSNRGDGEEEIAGEASTIVYWSRVFEDATACRVERGALRCDATVVISATRTASSDTTPEHVFATSYRIDDAGHVRPDATYVEPF